MKGNKTLVIAMSFAVLIIMSVAYAAFANVITITANSTAAGMGKITASVECLGSLATTGVEDANDPVATGNVGSNEHINITATLFQPDDSITCVLTWKNDTPFTVKTVSGITGCSDKTGSASSPVAIYLFNKVSAGATLAPGSSTSTKVNFSYSTLTESQPSSLSASIACSLVWAQA